MSRANQTAHPTNLGGHGLTIREYFAAMAMMGSLGGAPGVHLLSDRLAQESVAHADALIAELSKEQK